MIEILKETYKYLERPSFFAWTSIFILMITAEIIATVLIPVWNQYFYSGVEAKDYEVFVSGLIYFGALMTSFALVHSFLYYVARKISFNVRTAMSKMLEVKWEQNIIEQSAYDNPDQRIQEDVKIATSEAMIVIAEVTIAVLIVVSLVYQMWGNLFMFELSVVYVMVASGLAYMFHRPLVNSEKLFQRAEADYRITLARSSIKAKWHPTVEVYATVREKYEYLIRVMLGFAAFSSLKSNYSKMVPLMVLVPAYFAGEITFGSIMGGVSQFELIVVNATIIVVMYPNITRVIASHERIAEFYKGLLK